MVPIPLRRHLRSLQYQSPEPEPMVTMDHVAMTIITLQVQVAKLTVDLITVTQQLQHTEQLNLIQTQKQIISQLESVTAALKVALAS